MECRWTWWYANSKQGLLSFWELPITAMKRAYSWQAAGHRKMTNIWSWPAPHHGPKPRPAKPRSDHWIPEIPQLHLWEKNSFYCTPLDFGVVCYPALLCQRLKLIPNDFEIYLGCESTKTRTNVIIFSVFVEVLMQMITLNQ